MGCQSLQFFLGCDATSDGGNSLQIDRNVFICDEGSCVVLGEDCRDGVFVCIDALCARSYVESSSHWAYDSVGVSCLGDCFSVVKVLLDGPAKLHFYNCIGVEVSVPSLVQ